jgi:hypothetical protein
MSTKFFIKSKTSYAFHKHRVNKNKKRILLIFSDWFKRKLELIIWLNIHERIIKGG